MKEENPEGRRTDMTKKFTEEQYQKIVEMFEEADKEYNMGLLNPNVVVFFQDKLYREFGAVMYFIEDWQPIVAIANPLTREWAHDKFVEKEKRYVWRLKTNNSYRLTTHGGATQVNISRSSESLLTESEIKAWGYNPEMFTRIEAKGDI